MFVALEYFIGAAAELYGRGRGHLHQKRRNKLNGFGHASRSELKAKGNVLYTSQPLGIVV